MLFGPNRKDKAVMDALGIKAKEWNSLSSEEKRQKYAKAEKKLKKTTVATPSNVMSALLHGVDLKKYDPNAADVVLEFETDPNSWMTLDTLRGYLAKAAKIGWQNARAVLIDDDGDRICALRMDDLDIVLQNAGMPLSKRETDVLENGVVQSKPAVKDPNVMAMPMSLETKYPKAQGVKVIYLLSNGNRLPKVQADAMMNDIGMRLEITGYAACIVDENGNDQPLYPADEESYLRSIGIAPVTDGKTTTVTSPFGAVQQTDTDKKKKKVIYDPSVSYDDALQEAIEEKWPNGIPTGDRKKLKKFEDKFENQWNKAKRSFEKRKDAEYKPMMKIADAVEKQGEAIEQIIKTLNGPGTP